MSILGLINNCQKNISIALYGKKMDSTKNTHQNISEKYEKNSLKPTGNFTPSIANIFDIYYKQSLNNPILTGLDLMAVISGFALLNNNFSNLGIIKPFLANSLICLGGGHFILTPFLYKELNPLLNKGSKVRHF